MTIKVLHIYRTYFPETQGGLQEAIRQIATGLKSAGCESRVFTLAKHPVPHLVKSDEAEIYRTRSVIDVASCDIGSPAALRVFRKLAAQSDILNFHYPWPFGDVLALLANPGKPYVITYHSDIVRQRVAEAAYAPLRSLFFARAKAIVTTSPEYASKSRFLSKLEREATMIPLSIASESISEPSVAVLNRWAARFVRPFFFFVGVLRYYKGLDYLISAAKATGYDIVIAGDGPEEARLRALATGAPNIHFLGRIADEDKFALFRLCRAVVFPSHLRAEAFGMALLEGAAMAKPLISTELGTGTSYVNIDGETGIVVPPANARALAIAMQTLLESPDIASRFGTAALDRCMRLFDTSVAGRSYRMLYERVIDSA